MTVFFDEANESRGVTLGPAVNDAAREYVFVGTDDEVWMQQVLLQNTPTSVQTANGEAVRQQIRLRQVSPGVWRGTVDYGMADEPDSRPAPETGDIEVSFDSTGGSQHITTSLETVDTFTVAGFTAPDHSGAINVTTSGPEGTDIVAPALKLSVTGYLPAAIVDAAFWRNVKTLTGRMNDAPFFGFDRGEVQFLGMTGSKRGRGDWQVQAGFAIEENAANLLIANGTITVTQKLGHDYLWVLFKQVEDVAAHALAMQPKAAYVERILKFGDFSTLGLGTQLP